MFSVLQINLYCSIFKFMYFSFCTSIQLLNPSTEFLFQLLYLLILELPFGSFPLFLFILVLLLTESMAFYFTEHIITAALKLLFATALIPHSSQGGTQLIIFLFGYVPCSRFSIHRVIMACRNVNLWRLWNCYFFLQWELFLFFSWQISWAGLNYQLFFLGGRSSSDFFVFSWAVLVCCTHAWLQGQ